MKSQNGFSVITGLKHSFNLVRSFLPAVSIFRTVPYTPFASWEDRLYKESNNNDRIIVQITDSDIYHMKNYMVECFSHISCLKANSTSGLYTDQTHTPKLISVWVSSEEIDDRIEGCWQTHRTGLYRVYRSKPHKESRISWSLNRFLGQTVHIPDKRVNPRRRREILYRSEINRGQPDSNYRGMGSSGMALKHTQNRVKALT